ncbi:class I SAM-dependent methyltransferase [Ferrimonas pelagia]|uniref:Methyltransferase domain-containing protein n=1 Tax=Ferrimonas pelagia TaxID=1177826 RepID=A0ABP9ECR0_9GAMM
MPSLKTELTNIIRQLQCVPTDEPGLIKHHQDAYLERLCQFLELDLRPATFIDQGYSHTAAGKAVSPQVAAMCAMEYMRVQQFQQGILAAIAAHADPAQPLQLLYAGTGPLGTLVLPLLLLIKPSQVRITLLDIHRDSLDTLKRVLDELDLGEFIEEIVLADAITWHSERRFDLIVSETMKAMLEQEPQVRIFANLSRCLKPGGSLIPQQIRLSATLYHRQALQYRALPLPLGPFFTLDRATAQTIDQNDHIAGTLSCPPHGLPDRLDLATDIQIFADIWLTQNQSSLNLIKSLTLHEWHQLDSIAFHYQWGREPCFVFQPSGERVHEPALRPA